MKTLKGALVDRLDYQRKQKREKEAKERAKKEAVARREKRMAELLHAKVCADYELDPDTLPPFVVREEADSGGHAEIVFETYAIHNYSERKDVSGVVQLVNTVHLYESHDQPLVILRLRHTNDPEWKAFNDGWPQNYHSFLDAVLYALGAEEEGRGEDDPCHPDYFGGLK